nr:AAA family ATPase [Candidatus Shikimatogenerans silvanidophilus]
MFKTENKISNLLKNKYKINYKEIEKIINIFKKINGNIIYQKYENIYNALEKYTKNLNHLANEGNLDPIIGRNSEIRRVLQILSRRNKNNPILIGEPGVGKTAIAEGLAHRIINGDVPTNLKNKQILSLELSSVIAGARYKGEFEDRLKSIIQEIIFLKGKIILFIDEIHTLVGAGGGEGSIDASNIFKPYLSKGEVRVIGATTLNEYQKFFEKDKALERRFQKVYISEPDIISSIYILRGIKKKYEKYHNIKIKDEAIVSSVEFSNRYITDRFLPDKAIDLIDEAASKIIIERNYKPELIEKLDREIIKLEIQIEYNKIKSLKKKLLKKIKERNDLNKRWKFEKKIYNKIQKTKKKIEDLQIKSYKLEILGEYGKVSELRYGIIKEEEYKLKMLKNKINENKVKNIIKEEVNKYDIAEIVSKWTGIPVNKMVKSEKKKILNLENELGKKVIGQKQAIKSISDSIIISRAGLQDEKKIIGSFLFMGTTGVGKTELAKSLSEYLFENEKNLIRIDMSEYQEKNSISKFIGSPPGYIGYDEGGQLTELVRRKPYSVILLDEIEKAHKDIFNILLQLLDDGRLTDNKGRIVNFKNTIIIMTSNIGFNIINQNFFDKMNEFEDEKIIINNTKNKLINLLKTFLKPEFLNRIDDIILFKPLNKKDIKEIVKLQLNNLVNFLEKKGIIMKYTIDSIEYLAKKGYNPYFGARPIKRYIKNDIINKLSKKILKEEIKKNSIILLDYFKEKGIIFRKKLN